MTLIKRYKLISSPSFENELEKIHCYLSKQLNEPDIANKFYSKVRLQVNSLKLFSRKKHKNN